MIKHLLLARDTAYLNINKNNIRTYIHQAGDLDIIKKSYKAEACVNQGRRPTEVSSMQNYQHCTFLIVKFLPSNWVLEFIINWAIIVKVED